MMTRTAVVSVVFLVVFVGASLLMGCTTTFTEMQEHAPYGTIKLKGSYKSAAHCFYHAMRDDVNYFQPIQGKLEFPPEKDYAEWISYRQDNPFLIVIISDISGGNSSAALYSSQWFMPHEEFRRMAVATQPCQVVKRTG
jgi:hypothetical protein